MRAGDLVIDVEVDDPAAIGVIDRHQRLQGGVALHVGEADCPNRGEALIHADDRHPVGRLLRLVRAGQRSQCYAWLGCQQHFDQHGCIGFIADAAVGLLHLHDALLHALEARAVEHHRGVGGLAHPDSRDARHLGVADVVVQVIQDEGLADHALERAALALELHRVVDLAARLDVLDGEHLIIRNRDRHPHVVRVALQPAERHVDEGADGLRTLECCLLHFHRRVHIVRAAAAHHHSRQRAMPLQELHSQRFRYLGRVILPGLVSLIDARLVRLGLVARQVGEDAGEGHLRQCSLTRIPGKFAEEVLRPLCTALASVQGGVLVHFGGHHAIVVADLRIALDESLHLEELYRFGVRNLVEDVDIQRAVGVAMAHRDERLQRRVAQHIGEGLTRSTFPLVPWVPRM